MEITELQKKEDELNMLQEQDNALCWRGKTDQELLRKIKKCREEWHVLRGW